MNKISSEKRKHLVLVALVTVVAIAGVGYGLIKPGTTAATSSLKRKRMPRNDSSK